MKFRTGVKSDGTITSMDLQTLLDGLLRRVAFQPDGTEDVAVTTAVGALVAAADEDTATGGPDLIRGILPNIVAIDVDGIRDVDESLIRTAAETALGGVR